MTVKLYKGTDLAVRAGTVAEIPPELAAALKALPIGGELAVDDTSEALRASVKRWADDNGYAIATAAKGIATKTGVPVRRFRMNGKPPTGKTTATK